MRSLRGEYCYVPQPHRLSLNSFQPVPDSCNHSCHLHNFQDSQNQVPCLNSVIINSQPWILFTVKSCLLFSSDPATMCSPFMYISHLLCFCWHLVYPQPHTHCECHPKTDGPV